MTSPKTPPLHGDEPPVRHRTLAVDETTTRIPLPQLPDRGSVFAVDDDTAVAYQWLTEHPFADIPGGRLVIPARPGMRRVSWFASDTAAAFGADPGVSGAGRAGEGNACTASALLAAHGIRDVLVPYAWSISDTALREVCEVITRAGANAWLIGDDGLAQHQLDALESWEPILCTGAKFVELWAGPPSTSARTSAAQAPPAPQPVDLPNALPTRLPGDDFTTFRAACRRLLTDSEFAVVDDLFCSAVRAASEVFTSIHAQGEFLVREELTAQWLHGIWEEVSSWQEFIVRLRAAQVAAFHRDLYLQVDLDQVLATAAVMPRRAIRNARTWEQLRAYSQPYRAAACALAAARMSAATITTLTIDAYDHESGQAQIPAGAIQREAASTDVSGRVTIEEPARIYMRIQQLHRLFEGASPHDLLLVQPGNKEALTPRSIGTVIRQARRELGTAVALAPLDLLTLDSTRWQGRFGISLQELT